MNNSRLYIALAILVAVGAAVVFTQRARESHSSVDKPSATLPVIKKDEVTRLEIGKPGQPVVILDKATGADGKWEVSSPIKAAASDDVVSGALDKLADLTVSGVAATRKENHARLEVDSAHGIHVRAKAGDKTLLDLYVGQSKGAGTIVREEGKEAALVAKGSLRHAFDKELKDFRQREITELDTTLLSGLVITSPKGNFKFERAPSSKPEEPGAWAQVKSDKPIPKFDGEQVGALLSTAAHLRAADFASATDSEEVTGLASPTAKLVMTKKEGGTVEVLIGKQHAESQDFYVRTSESTVVYRVTKSTAERLMPDAKSLEKTDKPAQAAAPAGMPEGLPPGMQMMGGPGGPGGPGGGQITPEMMEQIKRQLAAQGQAHP